MSTSENTKIVRSVYESYNKRDFNAATAHVTSDVEILNVPLGATLRGPEGIRQFMQGWDSAFPDSRVEVTNIITAEDGAVVEFRGRGTHTGPLQTPGGPISATGREVSIPFCDVIQIKSGKIASIHSYYDVATMMRQLGLMG